MNNSCATVETFPEYIITETYSTDSLQGLGKLPGREKQNFTRFARDIALFAFWAISPVTSIADPWLYDKRRRDAVVTMSVYQEVIGRIVSRSEALRLAQQILINAERERLAVAEFEAARGIQWEGNE